MTEEELNKITNSMKEKLGDEGTALIADDFGLLFSANASTLKSIHEKDETISKLKSDKEKLVLANGNLLKQIPLAPDTTSYANTDSTEEVEGVSNFSFKSAFDERGRFIK